jgi:hypothetical protein
MGFVSGLRLELAEFFGDEGMDFLFGEAEVEGFDDKLVEGGGEVAAAGVDFEGGRLMGDVGADAALCLDETFFLEVLVNFDDGEGVDVKLSGEVADGGELGAMGECPGEDALLELLLELQVKRDAAGGVEKEHGVIVQ